MSTQHPVQIDHLLSHRQMPHASHQVLKRRQTAPQSQLLCTQSHLEIALLVLRHLTNEPKPCTFAGLTQRPPCAACDHEACLAEGLGIRATVRVFEVDPNTVLQWLVEAAEQVQAFSLYFLCDVHVTQLQLDELYAVLRGLRDGEISEAQALKRLESGHPCCLTPACVSHYPFQSPPTARAQPVWGGPVRQPWQGV